MGVSLDNNSGLILGESIKETIQIPLFTLQWGNLYSQLKERQVAITDTNFVVWNLVEPAIFSISNI